MNTNSIVTKCEEEMAEVARSMRALITVCALILVTAMNLQASLATMAMSAMCILMVLATNNTNGEGKKLNLAVVLLAAAVMILYTEIITGMVPGRLGEVTMKEIHAQIARNGTLYECAFYAWLGACAVFAVTSAANLNGESLPKMIVAWAHKAYRTNSTDTARATE